VDVNHQSVDWEEYFYSIRKQCPWSLKSWRQGRIAVTVWTGHVYPLKNIDARVYIVPNGSGSVEQLAQQLDTGDCEWLFSHPGYGEYAAPVPVLIQQNRQELAKIRQKLSNDNK
jgi:hypothetical protein